MTGNPETEGDSPDGNPTPDADESRSPTPNWHDLDEDPDAEIEDCPDCQAHRDGTTCAECDHDARSKWGYEGNYATGERVKQAEDELGRARRAGPR